MDYRKRKQDQEEYEHPDRDDHRFPEGGSFPPMYLLEKRRKRMKQQKGE